MRVNKELVKAIQATNNIVLATHIRPDGDALGSLFGFADILASLGKRVVCYLEEPVPDLFTFLPVTARIETDLGRVLSFVDDCGKNIAGICLDCGDLSRLGRSGTELKKIAPFMVIDHHQGNIGFGDITWIEPGRSATGEMIYDLAGKLFAGSENSEQQISTNAAVCLYTAIVTDTGSFRYDSTTAHTFAVAGKLVAAGVDPGKISQSLYDTASFERMQLMQRVLATLESFFDDRVAVIQVSQQMLADTGTDFEDCEGFINMPRSIAGVQAAVFLKESDAETRHISVSLRAKGECDVAEVAAQFGGGGHRNAAGFRKSGKSMTQVRDMLLPVLEKALAGQ
jgi:phosphoesterase RecJ-like protein